jgi:hypothetical protein
MDLFGIRFDPSTKVEIKKKADFDRHDDIKVIHDFMFSRSQPLKSPDD